MTMASSLLQPSFVDVTDPVRLHAELWADHVSKIISCWLPILMSTVVVGRDLLGSNTECFPLNLVTAPQPENGTLASDGNSTSNPFSGTTMYTRQLSQFVNVYCAGKDTVTGNVLFSYQQFAMMLVIQAAVMYTPFLIWNVNIGKEIICNVRFLAHDMEVLYERFRKKDHETKDQGQNTEQRTTVYGQEELLEAEQKWRKSRRISIIYVAKQFVSILFSVFLVSVYLLHLPLQVQSVHEKFQCSVENRFSVTCTVPAASVHRLVWWTNMVLLLANVILIVTHIIRLHALAKEQPFAEIGIEYIEDETQQGDEQDQGRGQTMGHAGYRLVTQTCPDDEEDISNVSAQSELHEEGGMQIVKRRRKCWPPLNDSHMMYSFFKANIESVEKYNYVKGLLKITQERHVCEK